MSLGQNEYSKDLKPILLKVCIFLSPVVIYLLYRIYQSGNSLISLSVLAMILGAIIEDKRLTPKWSTVLFHVLFAFVFSFVCFIPGKRETEYILENHIILWPYSFLAIYILYSIVEHEEKILSKLSEGITLIMSVAIIYWIIGHGFHHAESIFSKVILGIVVLFSLFSALNAFTRIKLTNSIRLTLSIWSSIIMLIFASEYIYSIYSLGAIEECESLEDKLTVALQYFLLGVSCIYIVQNLFMVILFLPSKGRFFNKAYFEDIAELKQTHLKRYSENQSSILISLIGFILSTGFFYLNYNYNFLQGNTAIWLIFFIMNSLIYYYEQKNANT